VAQPALVAGGPLGAEPGAEAKAEVLPAVMLADEIQNSGPVPTGDMGELKASSWKSVAQRSSEKNRVRFHRAGQAGRIQAEITVN
jgi:hypothetical protein